MDDVVQVSVYCLAYNHEKYIRKTLEGFVNQKTDFSFKVVVHDDASTDGTAAIIREYEEKYPEIIEPIYQKENQYSKGMNFITEYITPRLEGKYIASCEGDDYWCDENKLQKQFDIMERNPEMALCVHRVGLISESGEPIKGTFPHTKMSGGYLPSKQFIEYVCSDFFQLSSVFYRMDTFYAFFNNMPEFAKKADVGDIPLFLYLGSSSKEVYFFDEIMSCYRVNSVSSVTQTIGKDDTRLIKHYHRMMDMIDSFDQYTGGAYHAECGIYKERETFETLAKQKNIVNILKHRPYRRRLMGLPIRAQASITVKGFLLIAKNKVKK